MLFLSSDHFKENSNYESDSELVYRDDLVVLLESMGVGQIALTRLAVEEH